MSEVSVEPPEIGDTKSFFDLISDPERRAAGVANMTLEAAMNGQFSVTEETIDKVVADPELQELVRQAVVAAIDFDDTLEAVADLSNKNRNLVWPTRLGSVTYVAVMMEAAEEEGKIDG